MLIYTGLQYNTGVMSLQYSVKGVIDPTIHLNVLEKCLSQLNIFHTYNLNCHFVNILNMTINFK